MPAFVRRVEEVDSHPSPEKPHLGVFTLSNGAVCIGIDPAEGRRRFAVGDLVVHVEPGSAIPEWIEGFDNLKNRKVKASNFAGVRSEGIMLDVYMADFGAVYVLNPVSGRNRIVSEGDDVGGLLGIT